MKLSNDTSTSSYWENRYLKDDKPWDAHKVPKALKEYLENTQETGRVLVPGCGSAYEARAFVEAGFDVLAIDFSPAAVKVAKQTLGPWNEVVTLGDFFSFEFGNRPFDIIYERAFLTALPRTLRTQYAKRLGDLLRVGGRIIGFYFYSEEEEGPPFGLKQGELSTLFENTFTCVADREVQDSVPFFAGRERWQVWERIS
jgi:SAM-dependent methyltransferase